MKKMKKVFAIVLAMAMVLGMSITTFAAAPAVAATGSISVSGLKHESTEVTIYNVVKPDANGNRWDVADWATETINVEVDPATYNIAALKAAAANATAEQKISDTTSNGSISFSSLEAGVYLVIAETKTEGSTVVYSPMLAITYNKDTLGTAGDLYLRATAANVVAKYEDIPFEKTADTYVAVGTDVEFTVSTIFPSFHNAEGADIGGSYVLTDTPTGLSINESTVRVEVGGTTLTKGTEYELENANGTMTITFKGDYIGTENTHAGELVTVEYTATVNKANGIKNNAQATITGDGEPIELPGEKELITGTITFTKTGNKGEVKLPDAEFKVYFSDDNETTHWVKTVKNNEVESWTTEESEAYIFKTDSKGEITISGLDADVKYFFKEVGAPEGYSINETDEKTTWDTTTDPTAPTGTASMDDTKLSALPSTGGIGTTIFTIGGCAIIVVAAGLFFASRRKKSA